jgi:hypothetical protein
MVSTNYPLEQGVPFESNKFRLRFHACLLRSSSTCSRNVEGYRGRKLRNAMQFQGKPARDTIFVHCRFREETLGVPINLGLGPVRRFRD